MRSTPRGRACLSDPLGTLVVGGGQAGLAAGYHLERAGLSFTILEAGEEAGGSWPDYYDSLRLFSPARYSGLPGLPFPGLPDRYPTREEVVAYLRGYAETSIVRWTVKNSSARRSSNSSVEIKPALS